MKYFITLFFTAFSLIVNGQNANNKKGFIGIQYALINDSVIIKNVVDGSPAYKIGIQNNDVIISINGQLVSNQRMSKDYISKLLEGAVGEEVVIDVLRKVDIRGRNVYKSTTYRIKREGVPIMNGPNNTTTNSLAFITPNKFNCNESFNIKEYEFSIEIKIKDFMPKTAYLTQEIGDNQFWYIDTFQVDKKGTLYLNGLNALYGYYYVVIPDIESIFLIISPDDNKIKIESSKDNFIRDCKVSGSNENDLLYKFINEASNYATNERVDYLQKFIDKNENSVVSNLARRLLLGDDFIAYGTKNELDSKETKEGNTLVFKSNVNEFTIISTKNHQIIGKSIDGIFTYYLEKIKDKNLEFIIQSDTYTPSLIKFSKENTKKEVCLKLIHTKEYIHQSFEGIRRNPSISVLEKFLSEFKDFEDRSTAEAVRDSLEIYDAKSTRDEDGVKRFIENRPKSSYLQLANQLYEEFSNDRIQFENAIKESKITTFKNYIEKYPNSKYIKETKINLISTAYKLYYNYGNLDSLINFYKNYILTNSDLDEINSVYPEKVFNEMTRTIDSNYVNRLNAGNDKLVTLKNLWFQKSRIESLFNKPVKFLISKYAETISSIYFNKLSTSIDNISFENEITEYVFVFKDLISSGKSKLLCIIDQTPNKNVDFIIRGQNNIADYLANINYNSVVYRQSFKFKDVYNDIKELPNSLIVTFKGNYPTNLIAKASSYTYSYNVLDEVETFVMGNKKVLSYYNGTSLIYSYEFENDKNITLEKLGDNLDKLELFLSQDNLEGALSQINVSNNNYPSNINLNIRLAKLKSIYQEKRNKEDRRIAEIEEQKRKKEQVKIESDNQYNVTNSNKTLFNSGDDVYAYLSGTWVSQGSNYVSGGKKITFRNYYFDSDGISGSISVKNFRNDAQLKQGISVVKICPSGYPCDELTVTGIGRIFYLEEIWIKQ